MHLTRHLGRRTVAGVATIGTAIGVLLSVPAHAAPTTTPTKPPNPSNQQLHDAASAQDSASSRVGALGAQIAQTEAELTQLQGQAELAEQKVALRYSQQQVAEQRAIQAQDKLTASDRSVAAAHLRFVRYVQASFTSGSPSGTTGSLLTATDPSALLDDSALAQFEAQAKLDAVGSYQRARVTQSNLEAAARRAVAARQQATKAAQEAKAQADNAVSASQQQQATLESSLAVSKQQFEQAQLHLATLTHERSQYNAYLAFVAEQKRLAAIARQKAIAAARARAQAAAAARARKQAAELAAEQRRHSGSHSSGGGHGSSGGSSNSGSGGGSDSGSGGTSTGPSAPSGGGWTAAKGRQAVARAMGVLGTPYAWAGGGVDGPSYGVCDASAGAPNDCYVRGFDCSGLAMYAWGQDWDHYSATQFSQAGSYHPSAANLRPGDLIFWSFNGAVSGIHHVAVYKGDGMIIEAPYSGGYVQIAPLYEYGSFFGATRPLT